MPPRLHSSPLLFLGWVVVVVGTAAAQTLAEWERRKDNLWKELDFAFADVMTW